MTEPRMIAIDDDLIRAAATAAVRSAFRPGGQYGGSSGAGYQAIEAQVATWAREQDYTAAIEAAARDLIPQIVREALRSAIAAELKRQLKEMQRDGAIAELIKEVAR